MTKKNSPVNHIEELHPLEESSFVQVLTQYGNQLIYGLAALFGLIFILYLLGFGSGSQSENSYFQAENDFLAFQQNLWNTQDPGAWEDSFRKLRTILKKHPELHAKYDGPLAQTLLIRGDAQQAQEFAQPTLARTEHEDLGYYHEYATTSLLVGEGKTQEALDKALILKQHLLAAPTEERQPARGEALFAFNLLRIAALHQKLGNAKEELATWQEWKRFANDEEQVPLISPQTFEAAALFFEEGETSLDDYISFREKVLKEQINS